MKKEIGIHELFRLDPERADYLLWGRRSDALTRRGFVKGLAGFSGIIGAQVVYHHAMPTGLIPAVFANTEKVFVIEGKDGLRVLNDRPLNAETPAHLLNDDITPTERFFIRNNGIPPAQATADGWVLTVDGESAETTKSYTITELKRRFTNHTRQLTLECGGNGRAEYDPPASGNQWTLGAVGCPEWNGVRLKDVLEDAGLKDDAVYIAYYGADTHLSRQPGKIPISRGVPVDKALQQPLALHGHAWAGDVEVAELHISIDFGRSWSQARLQAPANRLAWQNWDAEIRFPATGYYEVWARAVDTNGISQPMVIPGWKDSIRLMQAEHGLWDLGAAEAVIIDYLTRHYSPAKSTSRVRKGRISQ